MGGVERSETRYARSGELSIAYQVVGGGPFDLVYVPGWVSNIELMWEEPGLARFLERLASFSRLILFDKRGTGLSDPVPTDALPTLEERMDDVRAVMDAVGSERAALLGHSEGGNMCVLFTATYPERTTALILVGSYAKRIRSEDYPWAPTAEQRTREIEETEATWGSPEAFQVLAPSKASDQAFQRWIGRYLRQSASPKAAAALMRMNTQIDVRDVLPTIGVPTLLIYRTDDADVQVDEGRYIAERIPGSTFVELPGIDHLMWTGDTDALLDEIEGFLTGVRRGPDPDRVLATVLFTDVVGSTETANRVGDRAWRSLLDRHHQVIRRELERWRGREIDTAGDGFLTSFDSPTSAITCAQAVLRSVHEIGVDLRIGLHTGECDVVGDKLRGIAVHVGARVASSAGSGEILVSQTVKDLVTGSGIEFQDRGSHELKGVPGEWRLYSVI
jgi:pimeloyl-ACP methyl ester carboxylesterase